MVLQSLCRKWKTEYLLACGGGSPPGFRLPLTAVVGVNPKHKKKNKTVSNLPKSISFLQYSVNSYDTTKIPGTEVSIYTQPNYFMYQYMYMRVYVCIFGNVALWNLYFIIINFFDKALWNLY